jgi:predicted transcriptional regulator
MSINDTNILKLKNRREIYDLVLNNPGLHVREISRKLNIPKTTANYHLRFLERKSLVKSEIKGKFTRYFASNNLGIVEKNILRFLREDIPRRIFFSTLLYDEMYVEEIGRDLDIATSTIIYHLKKFIKYGVVESNKKKRRVVYFVKNRQNILILLDKYKDSLIDDTYFLSFLNHINYLKTYDNFPIKNTHKRNINTDEFCDIINKIFHPFFSY